MRYYRQVLALAGIGILLVIVIRVALRLSSSPSLDIPPAAAPTPSPVGSAVPPVVTLSPPRILLNEDFSTQLAPTRWHVIDSRQRISVNAGGFLSIMPGILPNWQEPSITGPSFDRTAGRLLVANVLHRSVGSKGPLVRWASTASAADPLQDGYGLVVQENKLGIVRPGRSPLMLPGMPPSPTARWGVVNTEYIYAIVQRPQGAFYFVSTLPGGTHAAWPQASLVWVDRSGSNTNLLPAISNYSQEAQIDDVRVVDLGGAFADGSGQALALAADTFTREDGPLRNAERGGDWQADPGWLLRNGSMTSTATSGSAIALLDGGSTAGIVEATVHTPAGGNVQSGLIFHAADPHNFLAVELMKDGQGNRLQLFERRMDQDTVLARADLQIMPDTDYRLVVVLNGATALISVNDILVFGGPSDIPQDPAATRSGVFRAGSPGLDNGARFDDFAIWPATVRLPAEAGLGPAGGARGSERVLTSVFTAPDTLDGWTALQGSWTVSGRGLRVAAAMAAQSLLVRDFSTASGDAAATLTLPAEDVYSQAGLQFRYRDTSNFYFARFFHIPRDPTIEIELGRFRDGQGEIVRFFPVKLADTPGLLERGRTAILRVVANGPWITVYLNDFPVIEYYAADGPSGTSWGLYADRLDTGTQWINFSFSKLPGTSGDDTTGGR